MEQAIVGQGSRRTHSENPLAGTRYRATRRIGGGASSDVYAGVDLRGEPVAVKVLRERYTASTEVVWRLEREGRALATLRHPSIVPIRDAGLTRRGRPFLVMPLLRGATLGEVAARMGQVPVREACQLMIDVLLGLHAAHRVGIVHRDVTPSNIFVADERRGPRAVLLDFGLAKLSTTTFGPTTATHIVGTPRYVSPEQILSGEVDARTDVYAAGVVLYQLCSGRAPFDLACPLDTMRAHLEDEPAPIERYADVSPALSRAVHQALAKRPGDRFGSALAFARALEPAVHASVEAEVRR